MSVFSVQELIFQSFLLFLQLHVSLFLTPLKDATNSSLPFLFHHAQSCSSLFLGSYLLSTYLCSVKTWWFCALILLSPSGTRCALGGEQAGQQSLEKINCFRRTVLDVDDNFSCTCAGQDARFGTEHFIVWSPQSVLGWTPLASWLFTQEKMKKKIRNNWKTSKCQWSVSPSSGAGVVSPTHFPTLVCHQHSPSFNAALLNGTSYFSFSSKKPQLGLISTTAANGNFE